MTTKEVKTLEKVYVELTEEYEKAINNNYVFKPMEYALYQVWKKYDVKEKNRK